MQGWCERRTAVLASPPPAPTPLLLGRQRALLPKERVGRGGRDLERLGAAGPLVQRRRLDREHPVLDLHLARAADARHHHLPFSLVETVLISVPPELRDRPVRPGAIVVPALGDECIGEVLDDEHVPHGERGTFIRQIDAAVRKPRASDGVEVLVEAADERSGLFRVLEPFRDAHLARIRLIHLILSSVNSPPV